jgi:endonuclease YncB( thermonuclease family)
VRDIDRFGRIVGQCVLPDGRDIAAVMIASGAAMECIHPAWAACLGGDLSGRDGRYGRS